MAFLVFISLMLLYGMVSHRLERTVITAPIVFCVAGILLSIERSVINKPLLGTDMLLRLAEVAPALAFPATVNCASQRRNNQSSRAWQPASPRHPESTKKR